MAYCPSKLPPLIEEWNKEIAEATKNQYRSKFNRENLIAFKLIDPLAAAEEPKKDMMKKVENLLDSIYKDETILPEHYTEFMKKYNEDFETKLTEDPNFKFEYEKEVKSEEKEEVSKNEAS